MKLLILSDLHIGTGEKFGTFGWESDDFVFILERIKKKYQIDSVVLNGDVFELYQHTFDAIEQKNTSIVNYLKKSNYYYIRGNHDWINDFGNENLLITNSKGKKIYIEHGHNADFLNGTQLGRFLCRTGFHLLRILMKKDWFLSFYFRFIEFNDQVERIPKKYDSYQYLKYALRLLKNYDVVVLGHTHKIEEHKTYYLNNKKRYINCGSCSLGRFQGIILNTETLKYDTIKLSKEKIQKKIKKAKEKAIYYKPELTMKKKPA